MTTQDVATQDVSEPWSESARIWGLAFRHCACPECGAAPRGFCRMPNGRHAGIVHEGRKALAMLLPDDRQSQRFAK